MSPEPPKDPSVTEQVQMLFVRHEGALRGFILSLQPGFSDADDILQETFLTISRKAETFTPGTNFLAWAFRIARLKVLENYRRIKRSNSLSIEAIEILAENPPDGSFLELQLSALRKCVHRLAPKARDLMWRRYSGHQTSEQMAAETGLSSLAVRVALTKARTLLRECVQKQLKNSY